MSNVSVRVLMFLVLAPLYALLQCFLLFKQKQYSLFVKIVFLIVGVTEYGVSIAYLVLKEQAIQLEWFAVALISLFNGLFFILFLIDPVEDELKEYFSFGCLRKESGTSERKVSPSKNKRNDASMLA